MFRKKTKIVSQLPIHSEFKKEEKNIINENKDKQFKNSIFSPGDLIQLGILLIALISVWIQYWFNQDLFDESKKNDKLATRAYIGFEEPKFEFSPDSEIYTSISIKNVGRSQAHRVYSCAFLLHTNDKDSIKKYYFKSIEICERHKKEKFTLIPDMSFHRIYHFGKYHSEDLRVLEILKANDAIYLVGRVVYEDIFNDEHFVSFCFFYDHTSTEFLRYDQYNETD